MKKVWEKLKKTTIFFKFMVVYSVLLIIAVIVLLVWEWGALKDYQTDYDTRYAEAKERAEQGNTLCIDEYVKQYTRDFHKQLLLENIDEDNLYYTDEQLVEYKLSSLDFDNISYEKNEGNYLENRPVYDIKAGDEVIATVTLTSGSIDEFGFNTWKISGASVDASIEYVDTVELTVENGMSVYVDDAAVEEKYITEESTIVSNIYDRVVELAGEEEKLFTYKLSGLINADDIKVLDETGNEILYVEKEGVREYVSRPDEATVEQCTTYADAIVQAYVLYTNRWSTMDQMLAYTVSGSAASSAIKRADESVVFTKKPSTIEYTSKLVDNIHKVSDELFYCDVVYEIEKKVSGKPVNEFIKFTLLIRKQGDSWLLEDMAYNE